MRVYWVENLTQNEAILPRSPNRAGQNKEAKNTTNTNAISVVRPSKRLRNTAKRGTGGSVWYVVVPVKTV